MSGDPCNESAFPITFGADQCIVTASDHRIKVRSEDGEREGEREG